MTCTANHHLGQNCLATTFAEGNAFVGYLYECNDCGEKYLFGRIRSDDREALGRWGAFLEAKKPKDHLGEATLAMVKKFHLAMEAFTEQQLAEAIKQAVQCGDFEVVRGSPYFPRPEGESGVVVSQAVTYVPGRNVERLRMEVDRLEDLLRRGRAAAWAHETESGLKSWFEETEEEFG